LKFHKIQEGRQRECWGSGVMRSAIEFLLAEDFGEFGSNKVSS
jgi:hypothetical protein